VGPYVFAGTDNSEVKAIAVTADVSEAPDVESAIAETVNAFGHIDYCVRSVRTRALFRPIIEQKEETLDCTLSANVKGIWLCERAQIAQILKEGLRSLI
jgi:NAD(P)-dependent dehydrogenase (short-subunit alcohol dehydrogenase family)